MPFGAEVLQGQDAGHPHGYTAQWNDDIRHALHVLATGESDGYYAERPVWHPGRCLTEGFAFQFQSEDSPYRDHQPRGERITALAEPRALRAAAAVTAGRRREFARFPLAGAGGLAARRRLGNGSALALLANLGQQPVEGMQRPPGDLLYAGDEGPTAPLAAGSMPAWSVAWLPRGEGKRRAP